MATPNRAGMNRRALATASALAALIGLSPLALAQQAYGPPSSASQTPVPLAAPASIALSAHVLEEASRYHAYMRKVRELAARFDNGQAIENTLEEAESYEPQQLVRGAVAYGAVMALQDPAFVAGVRSYAVNAAIRQDIAERLLIDPNYVDAMPGAASAAALIRAALHRQSHRLRELGGDIKQAAYSIQKEKSWSKDPVIDREGRLSRAKSLSAKTMILDGDEVKTLTAAINGDPDFTKAEAPLDPAGPADTASYTTFINRSLAIAALAVLGQGGDENDAALQSIMSDASSGFCLSMSKLNLYQCLAVARPWYEDMFCLGVHAVTDTGECIAKAAGESLPNPALASNGALPHPKP